MVKKKVMVCMLAAAMAFTGLVPAIRVEAAGLTQASSSSQVKYASLNAEDTEIIKGLFDFEYYKAQNPDLVEVIGDDYGKLFEHFCLCGIFEGRTCNPNFDPAAYASAYSDLKDAFGTNIVKYYEHYAKVGIKENRNLTTLEACANAGITVQALVGDEVKIFPAVYMLAKTLNTNDFGTVQKAVNTVIAADSQANSSTPSRAVVSTDKATYLIMPEKADSEAYAKAKGLTKLETVKLSVDEGRSSGSFSLYLVKGKTGHAAYEDSYYYGNTDDFFEATPVYKTSDYTLPDYYNSEGTIYGYLSVPTTTEERIESGIDDYDHTNQAIYTQVAYEESVAAGGNHIHGETWIYGISIDTKTEETASDYTKGTHILKSYYTDYAGTQEHIFASDEERKAWLKENNRDESDMYREDYNGLDTDGKLTTTYDVGMEIEENEDGSLKSVTVGIYNDENEFGYVNTTTIVEKTSESE